MSQNKNNNQKSLSIPIKNSDIGKKKNFSRSWSGFSEKIPSNKKNFSASPENIYRGPFIANPVIYYDQVDYVPFNAVDNCRSAGIIPYCIKDGEIYFLFQNEVDPHKKKDFGLNDFGGKRSDSYETTAQTAAREFSEETSCLFYLQELNNSKSATYYNILKDNPQLYYDTSAVNLLKNLIIESQKYYHDKITEYVSPIYVSSKEIYISYFVKVPYIPEQDIPRAEDIHIPYDVRYIRQCKWYSLGELLKFEEKDFHKRLQITKIQKRIASYNRKGLFV